MTMLRILIAKDLRRTWRNPLPWIINIVVPLLLTALIGLVFGGKSDSGALGRVRFAIVDEDNSPLTGFLRGAASQNQATEFIDPVFLNRADAMKQITGNELSAVLIIPTNFTRDYLSGGTNVNLELIKNPAQSIHPAVIEEMTGALVSALNALSRNFSSEFPAIQSAIEGKVDHRKIAALIESGGNKIEFARKFFTPRMVTYEKEVTGNTNEVAGATSSKSGKGEAPAKKPKAFSVFAYLLVGMTGMFLLFLASNAMSDLYRELRHRTFERYQTLHSQLLPFIAGKVVYVVVLLLIISAILFIGGGMIFRIEWKHPWVLVALTFGYTCFAATLMACMVALISDERRAGALDGIIGMILGLAGGCTFPPDQLPVFLRENITPHMPSYWFVETARALQYDNGYGNLAWGITLIKLAVVSVVLLAIAAALFRRRFRTGARA